MSRRAQRKIRQSHRVMNALGKARRAMTYEAIVRARGGDRLCPFSFNTGQAGAATANHSDASSPFTRRGASRGDTALGLSRSDADGEAALSFGWRCRKCSLKEFFSRSSASMHSRVLA